MKKSVTSFVCNECGYESSQWLGKCPECGVWNSLREFKESRIKNSGEARSRSARQASKDLKPKTLSEITYQEKDRIVTGFLEMDTVLGGGIVKGSVTLIAGDPGIGKSTLLLQVALVIARGPVAPSSHPTSSKKSSASPAGFLRTLDGTPSGRVTPRNSTVLYVSGEESEEQIKMRAQRISSAEQSSLLLLSLNDTDAISQVIADVKPSLVIIDSIQAVDSQALEGLAGSVGQVRFAASSFTRVAKSLNIPVFIVGHVTKEGMVAGPMVLSHMVDTVLFLEGERFTRTRILRSLKNRFGPVDEVGVFSMDESGLIEVKNPEKIFLPEKREQVPGSVLVATLEGTRAFLVELQSLVVFSKFPMPRRVASGVDPKRLELLLAVLQKHVRLPVETTDVFVNVAGGIKLSDPAIDLGICLAVFSSFKNIPLSGIVGIAEVGLLGELRQVSGLDKRVKQAQKLGFKNIITAKTHKSLNEVITSLR